MLDEYIQKLLLFILLFFWFHRSQIFQGILLHIWEANGTWYSSFRMIENKSIDFHWWCFLLIVRTLNYSLNHIFHSWEEKLGTIKIGFANLFLETDRYNSRRSKCERQMNLLVAIKIIDNLKSNLRSTLQNKIFSNYLRDDPVFLIDDIWFVKWNLLNFASSLYTVYLYVYLSFKSKNKRMWVSIQFVSFVNHQTYRWGRQFVFYNIKKHISLHVSYFFEFVKSYGSMTLKNYHGSQKTIHVAIIWSFIIWRICLISFIDVESWSRWSWIRVRYERCHIETFSEWQ